jgi:hypothetical protein
MRTPIIAAAAGVVAIGACVLVITSRPHMTGEPTKAQKAEAKRAKDAGLLALTYPASTGTRPASMEISYDGAADRTIMTVRLTGLRVSGGGAASVRGATLYLTSSHEGRVRAADNPEGSVDGSIVVQASTPGILAYSGAPGTVTAAGQTTPLKGPSGKGGGYSSTKTVSGVDEIVRFRFRTEDLVSGVAAGGLTMTFGTIQVEVSGQNFADLREFVARLNPRL